MIIQQKTPIIPEWLDVINKKWNPYEIKQIEKLMVSNFQVNSNILFDCFEHDKIHTRTTFIHTYMEHFMVMFVVNGSVEIEQGESKIKLEHKTAYILQKIISPIFILTPVNESCSFILLRKTHSTFDERIY